MRDHGIHDTAALQCQHTVDESTGESHHLKRLVVEGKPHRRHQRRSHSGSRSGEAQKAHNGTTEEDLFEHREHHR